MIDKYLWLLLTIYHFMEKNPLKKFQFLALLILPFQIEYCISMICDCLRNNLSFVRSVTRFGDLLDFGQLFLPFGNNIFAQISHILRQFL